MKNVIKIGLFTSLMLVFSGCNDVDYEDKDLTSFFIQNNKEKLSKIYEIETKRELSDWRYWGEYESITFVSLSFWQANIPLVDFFIERKIFGCGYPMLINSTNVKFRKKDILDYGKESMYKEAERCLSASIKKIESEKISKLEKLEKLEEEQKEIEFKLNKKFNPNEIERLL